MEVIWGDVCSRGWTVRDTNGIMQAGHVELGRYKCDGHLAGQATRCQRWYEEPDNRFWFPIRVWGESMDICRVEVFHSSNFLGRCWLRENGSE